MHTAPGFSLLARVRHTTELIEAEIDGEITALSVAKGACYGFNSVASGIWRMIAEPKSMAEICSAMETEFRIDSETCEAQVLEFLEELRTEGLIEEVP